MLRKKEITKAVGGIFHVLNRGVDGRNIFLDEKDYFRFVHNLFEFNDLNPALNTKYYFNQSKDFGNPYNIRKSRKLIVEILAFCLMPNHFHLLLKQRGEGNIIKFMQKLGAGYANYFNQKYKRSGALFQGRYKLLLLNSESHFVHLPYYIHFNPLDLTMPEWRKGEIQNYQKAVEVLNSFRWSSHLDYIGKNNFPSVTQREFLLKIFGGAENYKDNVKNWLKEMEIEKIKKIILE